MITISIPTHVPIVCVSNKAKIDNGKKFLLPIRAALQIDTAMRLDSVENNW